MVGLRLNLIGLPDPMLDQDPWPSLLRRVVSLGWQVEVHAEARRLPGVVGPLVRAGVRVVVDHFGRPDPAQGIDDPGFRWLLSAAASRRVWVKLSGAYRNGADGVGERTAAAAMPLLRDSVGPERLLWGSDWPHTQFEGVADCATARAARDLAAGSRGAKARPGGHAVAIVPVRSRAKRDQGSILIVHVRGSASVQVRTSAKASSATSRRGAARCA